jgi:hypothetical protein
VKNRRNFWRPGRLFFAAKSNSTGADTKTLFVVINRSLCFEITDFGSQPVPEDCLAVREYPDPSGYDERTIYFKNETTDFKTSDSLGIKSAAIKIDHDVRVNKIGRVFGKSIGVMRQHLRTKNSSID